MSVVTEGLQKQARGAGFKFAIGAVGVLSGLFFVFNYWSTIDEASAKLRQVDTNARAIERTADAVAEIRTELSRYFTASEKDDVADATRFAQLEDEGGDNAGVVERLTDHVNENTDWRIEQEKRATIRIEEQKDRQRRLEVVEAYIERTRLQLEVPLNFATYRRFLDRLAALESELQLMQQDAP